MNLNGLALHGVFKLNILFCFCCGKSETKLALGLCMFTNDGQYRIIALTFDMTPIAPRT